MESYDVHIHLKKIIQEMHNILNHLSPDKMADFLADNISKYICLNENDIIPIQILLFDWQCAGTGSGKGFAPNHTCLLEPQMSWPCE